MFATDPNDAEIRHGREIFDCARSASDKRRLWRDRERTGQGIANSSPSRVSKVRDDTLLERRPNVFSGYFRATAGQLMVERDGTVHAGNELDEEPSVLEADHAE
jgi:hypothetical protein